MHGTPSPTCPGWRPFGVIGARGQKNQDPIRLRRVSGVGGAGVGLGPAAEGGPGAEGGGADDDFVKNARRERQQHAREWKPRDQLAFEASGGTGGVAQGRSGAPRPRAATFSGP